MDAVLRCVERVLWVAVVPAMVLLDRPGLRAISLTHRKDVALTRAAQAMQNSIITTADVFSCTSNTANGLITRVS